MELCPLIVIGDGAVLDFTAGDSNLLVMTHLVFPIFDKVNAVAIGKLNGLHLVASLCLVENDRTILAKVGRGHPFQKVRIAIIESFAANGDTAASRDAGHLSFLNQYQGYGNLFQRYEIKEPKQDPVTKRITVDISLTPYYAAKNFIIKLAADKKTKECETES